MTFARPRLLLALLLLWSGTAMAARSAYVSGPGVVLRANPDPKSASMATLPEGEQVQISNYPTQGFYKTRTASGQIGWVQANGIRESGQALPPMPSTIGSPTGGQDSSQYPYEDIQTAEEREEAYEPTAHARYPFELKAFGGFQLLSNVLSFETIGVDLFSVMPYFGMQFGIPLEKRLLLLFRVEHLSRSMSTDVNYDFSLSATPVMTGLSYSLLRETAKVKLQASFLVGVAFGTTLDATANGLAAPNFSELSTQTFTEMLKVDLGIPVSKVTQIFFETGYRFLKSSSIGPNPAGNGSDIFKSNGVITPIQLDLSGFMLGAGVGFSF